MIRIHVAALCLATCLSASAQAASDCVVLLHGLARTERSMSVLEDELVADGYRVANIGYASRARTIERLSAEAVARGLKQCESKPLASIHFVTHSLGGILVRYYLSHNTIDSLGRVVMLAPPNQGSEVVDDRKGVPGFELYNGPAGMQLGTDENSIPVTLGPVDFELGVIAGSRSINPILSLSLPDPDDGKVSVQSTWVEGMADFVLVPHTHTFITRSDDVIAYVKQFLNTGRFEKPAGR